MRPALDGRAPTAALAAALVIALAAAPGCGTSKPKLVDFSDAPREYRSTDYQDVYGRWTRHDKVIFEVESALEIWATFKSWDFREAFVAHYADAYVLPQTERDRLRVSQRDAAAAAYEFLVTAQSANYLWNDLEKKSSPWRVTMLDGLGREMTPELVKVVKLPDMFEREFFPAKTPFTRTYDITFTRPGAVEPAARGADGGTTGETGHSDEFVGERSGMIVLRLASPMGHADLRWVGVN